ncbi:hypothetical protein NGRA_1518 [Nosema granulosis]|uniref:Uncharacterized protein n=1 Tax=Nosema granulosis TaxID=83296 RepID=A0A9P6GZC0_9MICR|nr:hypothetical protein NGRA_1518 [Nosema granulosis]
MNKTIILICFLIYCMAVGIIGYLIYKGSKSSKEFVDHNEFLICSFNAQDLEQIDCRFKESDIMEMKDIKTISDPAKLTNNELAYFLFISWFIFTEVIQNDQSRNAMVDVVSSMIDSSDRYLPYGIDNSFLNERFKNKYLSAKYLNVKNVLEKKFKVAFNKEKTVKYIKAFLNNQMKNEEFKDFISKDKNRINIYENIFNVISSDEKEKILYYLIVLNPLLNRLPLLQKDEGLLKVATDELINSFKNSQRIKFFNDLHSEKSMEKQTKMIQDISRIFVKFLYYVIIPSYI